MPTGVMTARSAATAQVRDHGCRPNPLRARPDRALVRKDQERMATVSSSKYVSPTSEHTAMTSLAASVHRSSGSMRPQTRIRSRTPTRMRGDVKTCPQTVGACQSLQKRWMWSPCHWSRPHEPPPRRDAPAPTDRGPDTCAKAQAEWKKGPGCPDGPQNRQKRQMSWDLFGAEGWK